MAFEPVFEVVNLNSRRRLAKTQAVVEARLLPQPNVVIARVLSITADGVIGSSEVFSGEARYSGRINFKVLFVDVDGKNHCIDYNADFSDKIEDAAIVATLKPLVMAKVLDTDVVSVTASEIKLASVVEVTLDADMSEEQRYLADGGEDVYTHDDELEYARLVTFGTATAIIPGTLADVKLATLLLLEHKSVINSRESGVDSVRIEGVIISEICGETEEGLLASYRLETPFSEEFAANGARPSDLVVASTKTTATVGFESGESATINIEYSLDVAYSVYSPDSCRVIVDAFSVNRELLTTTESAVIRRNKINETVRDRVEGSVTLEVNMPIVDNILATTALRLNVTNALAYEDEALIEGIVGGNVIYYSAEANSENSVAVELPFSLKARIRGLESGDTISAIGEVLSATVKIRRGNEIDIRAEVAVEVDAYSEKTKCVITELSEGEVRVVSSAAVCIHIARHGETLWDVAKSLGATPEIVMAQNPGLKLPLEGGERILAYRHLTK